MKTATRLIGLFAIAMALSVVFSAGAAVASRPMPPGPQCENINTVTDIKCNGTTTESQHFDWTGSDMNINGTLEAGEVTGQIRYDENTIAMSGYTEFNKVMGADTCDTPNLDVMKTFMFVGTNAGKMKHVESASMDLISDYKATKDVMLCPFAAAKMAEVPASCELVSADSRILASVVVGSTGVEMGMTQAPVKFRYEIDATGVGDIAAGMDVYLETGSLSEISNYSLGTTLAYAEDASASGVWDFSKLMEYESTLSP